MGKIGVEKTKNGRLRALKCSPYIYLQSLYIYNGAPSQSRESLLAIDEAQGLATEEIRLLSNVNGGNVVFNLYGDINQHIEGTKGIDNWEEYREVIDFDLYEMQENYRNASQITEYCNKKFEMKMIAINTPGKGVHELGNAEEFRSELITQLMNNEWAGLAAILVATDAEARYLLGEFSSFEQKFHDMTEEDFSLHNNRWNIINIDDAKGLEFSTVIVISGRMTRNQKYIAYTRALDDLYVYPDIIDISGYEKKPRKDTEQRDIPDNEVSRSDKRENDSAKSVHEMATQVKDHSKSEVRNFFERKGLAVIDNRDNGGRLWVLGEKDTIRNVVNEAISKFNLSGKYAVSRETKNRPGWCTKTDK